MRFAALGDSVTVGLGDPMPDGGWRGWAGLLADSIGVTDYQNLARCGALVRDVAADQLPRALAAEPAVASLVVGVNDTLRGGFDLSQIARDVGHVVDQLTRAGAVVLTARLPEPGRMLGMPDVVCRPLVRRIEAINAIADDVAARHSTVHVDLAGHPDAYHRSMWGVDRLHPSEQGHRALALLFAQRLVARGLPVRSLPDPAPSRPGPTKVAQAAWLATKGSAWVARRSCDLLPALTRLVVTEWRFERRGRTPELDQRLAAELDRVLGGDRHGDGHARRWPHADAAEADDLAPVRRAGGVPAPRRPRALGVTGGRQVLLDHENC